VSEPLVFVLPLPMNIGNSRTHWAAKNRARREYYKACDLMLMARRLPGPPIRGPYQRALLDVEIHHTHDCDRTNREARVKWPEDWLTSRGYVVDDKDAHLQRTGEVRLVRCQKVSERKMVLTLTPLAGAA
jgi:hypothetical protein